MTTSTPRRKQRLIHPLRPPPAFWDNLSEIPLTRSALQELDRRNITETSSRRHPASNTRNTGPYDRAFQQHLINYRIYPDGFQYPSGQFPPEPVNLNDINQVLIQPKRSSHIPFKNFNYLTNSLLIPRNPDRYIVLSIQHKAPILPNFFLEVKRPDGSSAVAARQICYDGALGAKRIILKIYTVYPLLPATPGIQCEYVTTQVNSFALIGNADTFRNGVNAYRNARDWAKRKRDEAIEEANKKVKQIKQSNIEHLVREPILSQCNSNSTYSS
ncbi:hypothetical protein F5Y16DRAFT_413634 [Xylariaceae sp. FL0255]|nr:hypothetical protein F5Y16DRAFT_413634 [Xylariaceae sp. FL0255]